MVSYKKALSLLWKDNFSVTEYQEKTQPNGSAGFHEVIVLENQPCKLSYSTLQATAQNDDSASIVQTTKLFLDSTIQIKAGSKITVQHNGHLLEFCQSGEPGLFTSHQEIILVPFRRWA